MRGYHSVMLSCCKCGLCSLSDQNFPVGLTPTLHVFLCRVAPAPRACIYNLAVSEKFRTHVFLSSSTAEADESLSRSLQLLRLLSTSIISILGHMLVLHLHVFKWNRPQRGVL